LNVIFDVHKFICSSKSFEYIPITTMRENLILDNF
jgi:hypothetical protein